MGGFHENAIPYGSRVTSLLGDGQEEPVQFAQRPSLSRKLLGDEPQQIVLGLVAPATDLLTCKQSKPKDSPMNVTVSLPGPRYRALLQLLRTAETLWNSSRLFFVRWELSPSQFN